MPNPLREVAGKSVDLLSLLFSWLCPLAFVCHFVYSSDCCPIDCPVGGLFFVFFGSVPAYVELLRVGISKLVYEYLAV